MRDEKRKSLIVISGPTGSGKSALAVDLARRFDGEIVSADSIQVYRGFNIGSAKPGKSDLALIPHHLISILEPDEPFDAARFVDRAETAIGEIQKRGRLPIVVGGTGLYIRALLSGLVPIASGESNPDDIGGNSGIDAARRRVEAVAEKETAEVLQNDPGLSAAAAELQVKIRLHAWLESMDPVTAGKLRPSDGVRVRRALAVMLATGESLHQMQRRHANNEHRHRSLVLALLPERLALYKAIDHRVDEMIDDGLVSEVEGLLRRYPRSCRAFGSIGYRQIVELLYSHGTESQFLQAIDAIKRDSRRFAKRQLTWWRNQPDLLGWHQARISDMGVKVSSSFEELKNHLPGIIADFISGNGSFHKWPVSARLSPDSNFESADSEVGTDSAGISAGGSGDGNSVLNGTMVHLLRVEGVSI